MNSSVASFLYFSKIFLKKLILNLFELRITPSQSKIKDLYFFIFKIFLIWIYFLFDKAFSTLYKSSKTSTAKLGLLVLNIFIVFFNSKKRSISISSIFSSSLFSQKPGILWAQLIKGINTNLFFYIIILFLLSFDIGIGISKYKLMDLGSNNFWNI